MIRHHHPRDASMRPPPFLTPAAYATPPAPVLALPPRGQPPHPAPAPPPRGRAPEPFRPPADRPVDVKHIRLDLKVDLPNKTVDGVATLALESLRPLTGLALDAVDFEVKKVTLADGDNGGAPVPFSH